MKLCNHDVSDSFGEHPMGARIVNHEMLDCSDERELGRLAGLPRYQARALCITSERDVVQFNPVLRPDYDWAAQHYVRVGLPVSTEVVWDDSFDVVGEYSDYELDVFLFGLKANAVRPNQRRFEVVAEANSKNRFIQRCWELNAPTPETLLFDSKNEIGDLEQYQYPLYLKVSISVSGLGVWRCETVTELEARLRQVHDDVPFQIQQPIDAEFLNVQYFGTSSGEVRRVLATEQILDGNAHAGNRPTIHQPWAVTDRIASDMVRRGMRGIFAFDVAALTSGGYRVIECNPRYNGASYPTIVANRLGLGTNWMARNFGTSARTGADIDLERFEYNSIRKSGAILLNWGLVPEGKVGFMIVGDLSQQQTIVEAIETQIG